jgi:serine/threonine-protein kinase
MLGSYRITGELSRGGMGAVYRAEHAVLDRTVAVKLLRPELTANAELVKRFINEARAASAIQHPGIIEVLDFGHADDGRAYFVMEMLQGESLARRIQSRGRLPAREAAQIARGIASALTAAHGRGIVHRDLKPDNVFLIPDPDLGERPKLLDFGIAKLTDLGLAGTQTKTGAVMGTPTYMSPEQCRGTGDVDARADLYSIGCIFYELVTGRPPFTNLGAGELIGAHLYLEPEPPTTHQPELHAETVKLIMALLRKKPAERPQTAKELGQRLTDLAQRLGWITAGSPNGVTGPALAELAARAAADAPTTVDKKSFVSATEKTPLFTPGGSPAPSLASLARSLDVEAPVDKPTTLSGAASQLDLAKPRSRKGIGIAIFAAAALAGGLVTVKLTQPDRAAPAKAPIVEPKAATQPAVAAPPPAVEPPPPAPPPPPPPSPAVVPPAADEPEAAAKPEASQPDAATIERKRPQRRRNAVKKPEPKPDRAKPKPDPVKPPPLIERDIE